MTIFVITLLVVVAVVVLAYPFIARRGGDNRAEDTAAELAQQLRRARNRVYEEIRALQQEYFLDALTEEEYREQLKEARLQAAHLLQQQQQVQETLAEIDESVDAAMRQATGGDGPK